MGKLVIRVLEGIIPELDASESAASVLGRDPLVKRGHNQLDLESKLPEPFADCRSTLTSLVVWDQQDTAEGGLKGGALCELTLGLESIIHHIAVTAVANTDCCNVDRLRVRHCIVDADSWFSQSPNRIENAFSWTDSPPVFSFPKKPTLAPNDMETVFV